MKKKIVLYVGIIKEKFIKTKINENNAGII